MRSTVVVLPELVLQYADAKKEQEALRVGEAEPGVNGG